MALTDMQQAALSAEIKEAMAAQKIQQKDVALKGACTSTGNFSTCLAGHARMSETKWRGACEMLGIDYDAAIMRGAAEAAVIVHEDGVAQGKEMILTVRHLLGQLLCRLQETALIVNELEVRGTAGDLSAVLSGDVMGACVIEINVDGGALKVFATMEEDDEG